MLLATSPPSRGLARTGGKAAADFGRITVQSRLDRSRFAQALCGRDRCASCLFQSRWLQWQWSGLVNTSMKTLPVSVILLLLSIGALASEHGADIFSEQCAACHGNAGLTM
ncbi:uncharacterized protein METZ01_LOCUS95704, partial [marine metagenome]